MTDLFAGIDLHKVLGNCHSEDAGKYLELMIDGYVRRRFPAFGRFVFAVDLVAFEVKGCNLSESQIAESRNKRCNDCLRGSRASRPLPGEGRRVTVMMRFFPFVVVLAAFLPAARSAQTLNPVPNYDVPIHMRRK